jgi:hypothetical protein
MMTPGTERMDEEAIRAVYALVATVKACAETIKEFGRAPESMIFLALKSKGIGLTWYERIKDALVGSGLIKVENNEYVWVGKESS